MLKARKLRTLKGCVSLCLCLCLCCIPHLDVFGHVAYSGVDLAADVVQQLPDPLVPGQASLSGGGDGVCGGRG